MSSGVAVVGLTYDGTDVQDLEGLFLEITGGLNDSPDVRGVDVLIPGADGQTARPRRFDQRKILLSGFVRGTGASLVAVRGNYRSAVIAMLALFDATAAPADLVATLEDGSTATIAARTISVLAPEVIAGAHAAVSVELLAVADWVYEAEGS